MCAERPFELLDAQADGATLVEYTGRYVPEEITRAAGALAYPMWRGGEPEPPDAVLDESVRFFSPYVRTQYGLIKLKLDPIAEAADVYAFSLTDCHTYRICELVEQAGYPVCKVGVPSCWEEPDDYDYYAKKVRHYIDRVQEKTGKLMTDEALREAIGVYNRIRDLLRRIDATRKVANPPISGSDFEHVGHMAMLCQPEVAIEYLEKIADECEAQAAKADESAPKRPRIVMFGHVIAHGDYGVLKAVEVSGAEIVQAIMDDGNFRFKVDVDEEAAKADPFDAVIRNRYLDTLPNNNMQPSWPRRRQALLEAVEEYGADGVIWYDTLYDEIYDMEYSCLADELGKRGIPLLRLTTSYEYTREAMGPLYTRIETFVDTLKGGRR